MANFKITATTTVAELKEQFHNEFGGILRVYQGRSEAPEDATLVSLGGKVGELECRASRTVGKFIEAFQSELGLKVKVYTKDNWVSVLDGITLATVREIPKNARKAQMEQYLAYQRDEKEEDGEMNLNVKKLKSFNPDDYFFGEYGLAEFEENDKYGFIDTKGNIMIDCIYDKVRRFSDGFALVKKDGKYGFIDTKGNLAIDCSAYDNVCSFEEGLSSVVKNDKFGFIDTKGNLIIDCIYDFAFDFHNGIAKVEKDGKMFTIDHNGNVVE